MNNTQTISISQFRQNATAVIAGVKSSQIPTVILSRSKASAVIVDFDYFTALEEAVLDFTDNAEINKSKNEATVSLNDYIKSRFGVI